MFCFVFCLLYTYIQDEALSEVKRRAGIEFCSIYHPEIFLLEWHTPLSLSRSALSAVSHFACPLPLTSHFCDMWSFHFIPGWLNSALKICCCPPISFCSVAGSIELHRPTQMCSWWITFFPSYLQFLSAVGRTFISHIALQFYFSLQCFSTHKEFLYPAFKKPPKTYHFFLILPFYKLKR